MRVFFYIVLFNFLIALPVIHAQSNKTDSVTELQEVSVYARNLERQFVGNKIIYPSQSAQAYYEGGNLNELLQQQSNIHMKTYGNGMLSSIAFRGTTASQTSVIWNDFNINNYTLGQSDFSLLPVFASDELLLMPGGGSTYGGNGAIGGTIAIQNPLKYNEPSQLGLSGQVASFGKYQSNINYSGAIAKLAFHTTLYYQEAENDFLIASINQRQPHASLFKYGIKQQLGYELSDNNKLELAIWYHHNDREIQPAIRNFNNTANQQDDNFRSSLKYLYTTEKYQLKVGTGFFNDQLRYQEDSQISNYRTSRSESFVEMDLFPLPDHQITIETRVNLIEAYSDGFNPKLQEEQRYTWRLKGSGVFFNKLHYAAHIGQQIVSNTALNPFTPYLGLMLPLMRTNHQQLKIKANASYNYRVPTLNDRFWELPDREPIMAERAFNTESGISYTINQHHHNFNVSTTAFVNQISNYIQWVAVDGQPRPMNITDVEIKGLEIESFYQRRFNTASNYQFGLNYAFNKAMKLGEGNEVNQYLIYVPLHKVSASLNINYLNFGLDYYLQHTSKVYTTQMNNDVYAIPAFSLHDIGVRYKHRQLKLALKAKNLFDKAYQTYFNYAMPGRNFEFSINYIINTK